MYHELLLSNCDHDILHTQVHMSPLSPLLSVYQSSFLYLHQIELMQAVYKVQFLLDEFTASLSLEAFEPHSLNLLCTTKCTQQFHAITNVAEAPFSSFHNSHWFLSVHAIAQFN